MNYSWISLLSLGLVLGGGICLFFERKLIAYGQKRLGISFIGRHGWLHLPADVFKFWLKTTSKNINNGASSTLTTLGGFIAWTLLSCLFLLCHIDEELSFFNFSLLLYFAYVGVSTLYLLFLISTLRSKYSTLAGLRVALLTIFFEVPFNLIFLYLYLMWGDYTVSSLLSTNSLNLTIAALPLSLLFIFFNLVETKRAPHDHTEAESELVGGHLIEFGGRTLLVFFICEYLHLYFCIFFLLTVVLGGPTSVSFLSYLLS